ncbi:MAG: hypothetical protein CME62_03675 [Halobacteriovoraceae bacterium]|nr:hypothetical protein [Halobacteriovoraceae bacterium]|tara:strand:+ start:1583 stop:2746 length:1164 start_codon:yes stop_codon:yes gene_type:complete
MTPDHWLESLFHGEYFSGEFEHLKSLIASLNLNPQQSKIITIAGTNGKGETSRILTGYIKKHFSVYTWTSPHLKSVTERFAVDGEEIDSDKLIAIFEKTKSLLNEELKTLSYFEFLFLSFLVLIEESPPDYIILEVGLGGRLDATNTLDTDCAVVTSISRDHQHLLGNRLEQILKEKLGIMRVNAPLITSFETQYLRTQTQKMASQLGVEWMDMFDKENSQVSDSFTQRNTVMAQAICKYFEIPYSQTEVFHYASRGSVVIDDCEFHLYPSHNIDGLRKLVQFLCAHQYTNYDLVLVSFSKRSLSELKVMCRILLQLFTVNQIKLTHFEHIKSIDEGSLEKIQEEFKFEILQNKHIFSQVNIPGGKVLVTGSNYFLGSLSLPSTIEK